MRNSDASNSLMKFTWEITKVWFLHVRKILYEIAKWEKPRHKPREARQNWKEERKKKSNREKDYGRLRSVNENEKKGQKKKNEKRRLN